MTEESKLSPFEGLTVSESGFTVPGLAGGLREAMKIEPQEFRKGERVRVLADCVVVDIDMEAVNKSRPTGDQRRVHTLQVETAMLVPAGFGDEQLSAMREAITRAKDEARGQTRLDDEQLYAAHNAGEHTELVKDCVECQREVDAADEEAAGD